MPRGIDPAVAAALQDHFHPTTLLYLDWPGGPVRAHSGAGTMAWDGFDWIGAGNVGSITIPTESDGMVSVEAVITLVGPPAELMEIMAATDVRGRECEIWAGVTTTAGGNVLIGDPVSMFSGHASARRFRVSYDGAVQNAVQIEVSSGPPARASDSRFHSLTGQQELYPWDTGFRLLATLDRQIKTRVFPGKT